MFLQPRGCSTLPEYLDIKLFVHQGNCHAWYFNGAGNHRPLRTDSFPGIPIVGFTVRQRRESAIRNRRTETTTGDLHSEFAYIVLQSLMMRPTCRLRFRGTRSSYRLTEDSSHSPVSGNATALRVKPLVLAERFRGIGFRMFNSPEGLRWVGR